MSDYRLRSLVSARADPVDAFAGDGVVTIQYVSAFPQHPFAVWLGTSSDSEASRLRTSPTNLMRVHDVLVVHGFTAEDLTGLMVVVQSQETVDRDFAGSWFRALR